MSSNTYTIRNSRGTIVTTISETGRDSTSTSLVLHGRGALNYGLQRDENLIHVLENFSSSVGPDNPIDGQLWWETVAKEFFVWNEDLGSPSGTGDWTEVIPSAAAVGFTIDAGDGLISDPASGFPANSPHGIRLDVDVGNGLAFFGGKLIVNLGTGLIFNAGAIDVAVGTITHDSLSMVDPNEHVDHSLVFINTGDGLSGGGNTTTSRTLTVDSTVVRTSGVQSIAGAKEFTIAVEGPSGSAGTPTWSFSTSPGTGMYRSGTNQIGFSTGGQQRFRIESNGVLRSLNATYESTVTDDDDIPNKRYVDTVAGVAGGFRGAKGYRTTTWTWPVHSTPNFPACSTGEIALAMNAESYDTDNIHDNITNKTRLTVPAGVTKVRFSGGYTIQGDTSGGYRHTRVRKNGTCGLTIDSNLPLYFHHVTNSAAGSGSYWGGEFTTSVCEVTAGDYFECMCLRQANSGITRSNQWFEMQIIV